MDFFQKRLGSQFDQSHLLAFLLFSSLMSFGGVVWGSLCLYFGFFLPSAIPYGYVLVSLFNFFILYQFKAFNAARFIQAFQSVLLPFLLQWALGGYEASGVVMLWALLALVGALTFYGKNQVLPWGAFFLILLILSVYYEESFRKAYMPEILNDVGIHKMLLSVNVGMISTMIFLLGRFFIDQQRQTVKTVLKREEELKISQQEKEAAFQELLATEEEIRQNAEELLITNETLEQERQKLQESLEKVEKLSLVVKEVSNAVVITDADGMTEWVNEAFTRMTGYKEREIVGKKPGRLLQGEETDAASVEELKRKLTFKEPFNIELLNYRKNGMPYWVNLQITPVLDEKGNIKQYISIQADVSERKNAEKQIKHAFEELQVLKKQLEISLSREKEASQELEKAKNSEIAVKNEKIMSSLRYAQRIQTALLPTDADIKKEFPESFVLFRPKDIVSGDFYWLGGNPDESIIAAVDCTGHGVPGAIMSMIGTEQLTEIVNLYGISDLQKILYMLHHGVVNILKQDETTKQKDGMDMAICKVDKKARKLYFAGAKNPLIYIQDNELFYIKGDKFPIAGGYFGHERIYQVHEIDISQLTTFYLFSDGFQDQFGGRENKKFMIKKFKNLLLNVHREPMNIQKEILEQTLGTWMTAGKQEQLDDILVFGAKV